LAGNEIVLEQSDGTPQARFEERHYTVGDIADLWSLSPDVVRKLFQREPDVLVICDQAPKGKRRYMTLRIPQSVAERVHRRLSNPDLTPVRSRTYSSGSRDHQLLVTTDGP
jgi:hypothetical protein